MNIRMRNWKKRLNDICFSFTVSLLVTLVSREGWVISREMASIDMTHPTGTLSIPFLYIYPLIDILLTHFSSQVIYENVIINVEWNENCLLFSGA